MGAHKRLLLAALAVLLFGTVISAAPGLFVTASTVTFARDGDGALDAPVPAVGEPGGPSRVLTPAELDQWKRGRELFDRSFHRSEGCGTPEMNADSCRACHQDPAIGGAGGLELNVSRHGGGGMFPDPASGQALSKLRPPFAAAREEYDTSVTYVFEQRQTPSIFGGGEIDGIPESAILANEDPTDADNDGVSGVARRIDVGGGTIEIGRFGWKAQVPRMVDFARDAMGGEIGMTTPDDGRGFALVTDGDPIMDPELSQQQLDDLLFFLTHLARPKPGGSTSPLRAQGELLFDTVGCAKCHVPSLAGVPLFSDLLLHDVSAPGFQGMDEPGAPSGEYRTPPLWGNCSTAPYMHDGAAETVQHAILLHFGEAEFARLNYLALTQAEKDALLHFLGDI